MNRYRYYNSKNEHLHTLDGKPLYGTSKIEDVISWPAAWWASGMALRPLGWTPTKTPMHERTSACVGALNNVVKISQFPSKWLKFLDECYRNHKNKTDEAAQSGVDAHYEMEKYISLCIKGQEPKEVHESIKQMVEWSRKNVKRWLWSELHVYSENMWTGGIIDAGFEDNEGRICLGDFKNRESVRFKDLAQTGGYTLQLEDNGKGFDENGNVMFELQEIQTNTIDCIYIFPLKNLCKLYLTYSPMECKNMFESALNLFKKREEFEKEYKS